MSTAAAQNVNIPDPVFKAYLLENEEINTNNDAEIQVSEAARFTGEIDCRMSLVKDLTGIEAFTNLTSLSCNYNEIESINISKNVNLSSGT
jgi:Leucine-rich repeat (LRR) protein